MKQLKGDRDDEVLVPPNIIPVYIEPPVTIKDGLMGEIKNQLIKPWFVVTDHVFICGPGEYVFLIRWHTIIVRSYNYLF